MRREDDIGEVEVNHLEVEEEGRVEEDMWRQSECLK